EPQKVVGNLQRLLLALLILRAPQWTSPDVLSEALWPDSSAGAESRLHLHIHRLRARLGTGTIESGPDGYRLEAPTTPSTCGDSSVPSATCSPTISGDEPTPSCSAAWRMPCSCGWGRRSPASSTPT